MVGRWWFQNHPTTRPARDLVPTVSARASLTRRAWPNRIPAKSRLRAACVASPKDEAQSSAWAKLVTSGHRACEPRSCDDRSFAGMSAIVLRGGVEIENPLELALEFLAAYSSYEAYDSSGPESFDESDLRLANRGGARISAAEIAAILDRRREIERALGEVHPDASLADAVSSIPWIPLTRLFDAFADIRGVGFSKMTKTLHTKRPALIPMLDSVVGRT